jgi:hypothetical protein
LNRFLTTWNLGKLPHSSLRAGKRSGGLQESDDFYGLGDAVLVVAVTDGVGLVGAGVAGLVGAGGGGGADWVCVTVGTGAGRPDVGATVGGAVTVGGTIAVGGTVAVGACVTTGVCVPVGACDGDELGVPLGVLLGVGVAVGGGVAVGVPVGAGVPVGIGVGVLVGVPVGDAV